MTYCLACLAPTTPCIDFGVQPLADFFVSEFGQQAPSYELKVGFCGACKLVQLCNPPAASEMFRQDYPFRTSSSKAMAGHFRDLAQRFIAKLPQGAQVLEIGSNDGAFLRHFAELGFVHLGVDPASDACSTAATHGVKTWSAFFDHQLAEKMQSVYGSFDLIFAANTISHIEKIIDFFKLAGQLLAPSGSIVFEDPYLGDILEAGAFDQFYDEHIFYFSATAVDVLATRNGLQLSDVERTSAHGGQLRYHITHLGRPRSATVRQMLTDESKRGIATPDPLWHLEASARTKCRKLGTLVRDLSDNGSKIVGYGATAKSSLVMSLAELEPEDLLGVLDVTPEKQGRFTPNGRFQILSPEAAAEAEPSHFLLFAWNHRQEILEKEQAFSKGGGRWIEYMPNVKLTEGKIHENEGGS